MKAIEAAKHSGTLPARLTNNDLAITEFGCYSDEERGGQGYNTIIGLASKPGVIDRSGHHIQLKGEGTTEAGYVRNLYVHMGGHGGG